MIQGRASPPKSVWASVQSYLQTNGVEAGWTSIHGDTFLHWILHNFRPPLDVVNAAIEAYPEALETLNQSGRLPLHYASTVTGAGHSAGVFQAVFEGCPRAAFFRSCDGRLPLNYALNWDEAWNKSDGEEHVFPSLVSAIMSRRNAKCIRTLLEANPEAALRSEYTASEDPWEVVCKLWQHPVIEDKSLRKNLCLITLSVLHAQKAAIHGEDSKFRPLHAMLEQQNDPLSVDNLRAYFLHLISLKDANDALHANQSNRLCLSLAIEQGQVWTGEDGKGCVIKKLSEAAEEATMTRDMTTRMYPFMAAAEGENADLGTVFELLRCSPLSARGLCQNNAILALHEMIGKLKVKNQGLIEENKELKAEVSDLKYDHQAGPWWSRNGVQRNDDN
eukprot:CAMPEP_0116016766 /NCGR_PEP_ID=MMETSP0321-20121206/7669_1 /TAXON_ID=163516 /ORGANISM="Leptocylindrus danicus var. danicus, Strain B650" /LENGTH=389 /DNA_ID=CAMNT_0003486873 /DNA_START=244 /DNA_END=1413 /DNA_ORIENTATION=+